MTLKLISKAIVSLWQGAHGMAGSAIVRALQRNGYGNPEQGGELLTPNRQELNLLDDRAGTRMDERTKTPDVVVLAAATVGGIEANRSRPADFLLDNLRIETQVTDCVAGGYEAIVISRQQLHVTQNLPSNLYGRNRF